MLFSIPQRGKVVNSIPRAYIYEMPTRIVMESRMRYNSGVAIDYNDPLNVEWLIQQAKDRKKQWRKPSNEPPSSYRQWQEILDGRRAPPGM